MAKQLARLLEPHQPLFIEGTSTLQKNNFIDLSKLNPFKEPLLPTQVEEIADLKHVVTTPIALGERLYTRTDFRPYFERRAIDIAQPDVKFNLFQRFSNLMKKYLPFYLGISLWWNKRNASYCNHGRGL